MAMAGGGSFPATASAAFLSPRGHQQQSPRQLASIAAAAAGKFPRSPQPLQGVGSLGGGYMASTATAVRHASPRLGASAPCAPGAASARPQAQAQVQPAPLAQGGSVPQNELRRAPSPVGHPQLIAAMQRVVSPQGMRWSIGQHSGRQSIQGQNSPGIRSALPARPGQQAASQLAAGAQHQQQPSLSCMAMQKLLPGMGSPASTSPAASPAQLAPTLPAPVASPAPPPRQAPGTSPAASPLQAIAPTAVPATCSVPGVVSQSHLVQPHSLSQQRAVTPTPLHFQRTVTPLNNSRPQERSCSPTCIVLREGRSHAPGTVTPVRRLQLRNTIQSHSPAPIAELGRSAPLLYHQSEALKLAQTPLLYHQSHIAPCLRFFQAPSASSQQSTTMPAIAEQPSLPAASMVEQQSLHATSSQLEISSATSYMRPRSVEVQVSTTLGQAEPSPGSELDDEPAAEPSSTSTVFRVLASRESAGNELQAQSTRTAAASSEPASSQSAVISSPHHFADLYLPEQDHLATIDAVTQVATEITVSPVTSTMTALPLDTGVTDPGGMMHAEPLWLPPTPDQPSGRFEINWREANWFPPTPERTLRPRTMDAHAQLGGSSCSFHSPGASSRGLLGAPEYTSAKLLVSSSSKPVASAGARSRMKSPRPASPGPVVMPPSLPSHAPLLTPRGLSNSSIFDLFNAALTEPSIADTACRELLAKCLGEQMLIHWADIASLQPVCSIARAVTSAIRGSRQPPQEESQCPERLCAAEDDDCKLWWRALLQRHGIAGPGCTMEAEEFGELVPCALRMLRDRHAPASYLRNLRMVRCGAHRLRDRYDGFRMQSSDSLGRTYRCRSRLSLQERLCSQIRKDRLHAPSDQLRAEAEILRSIEHPGLPRVVESFEDFNSIYIISEVVDSIRLLSFVRARQSARAPYSEAWLSQVVRQVLDVFRYCHELKPRSYVHGDLRLDSIGLASISEVSTSPHVVITDLGLAGVPRAPPSPAAEGQKAAVCVQKAGDQLESIGPKRDVWSCGCILYMMLTGNPPYSSSEIYIGGPMLPPAGPAELDLAALRHCTHHAESLCALMLDRDPCLRPSAAKCLTQPWLQPWLQALPTSPRQQLLPLEVLDALVSFDIRAGECREVVSKVVEELSSGPLSCASKAFADAASPAESGSDADGARHPLGGLSLKALQAASLLLQLGVSVPNIEMVMRAFGNDFHGNIAYGRFAESCMDLAEDQLDRALWRIFITANEDHRGILSAAKLEQVLDGGLTLLCETGDADSDGEVCAVNYIRGAIHPELTASEAARQITQGGSEVTFEELKEFVTMRHDEACRAASSARKSLALSDGVNGSDCIQQPVH
eukprot:TRINITY_DN4611_c0_g2_i4.p1 TRINITY_DN4611_c0_g2~~TRINITY_DN4611_c0_g2_i4.p1  ORF type:complete len:1345 (+),score=219.40 TRINITY_DN4611_c0_g2_i4:102-4136(+)